MAGDLPEAFLGDRSVPLQPLSCAFDPTGPTLQQRWPCCGAPAGLLILRSPLNPLCSLGLRSSFFFPPHLKRQCCGSHINKYHFPLCLPSQVMGRKMEEVGRAAPSERKLRQKGRGQVRHLLHFWVETIPLTTPMRGCFLWGFGMWFSASTCHGA